MRKEDEQRMSVRERERECRETQLKRVAKFEFDYEISHRNITILRCFITSWQFKKRKAIQSIYSFINMCYSLINIHCIVAYCVLIICSLIHNTFFKNSLHDIFLQWYFWFVSWIMLVSRYHSNIFYNYLLVPLLS